jgi:calcium-dependent protein kinase
VVHRDLKLENLLMSDASARATLKVTDFGLSTFVASDSETMTDIVGSAWYTAPEVLHKKYHKQADIWSCGVILYMLLCGRPPFEGATDQRVYLATLKQQPRFHGEVWDRISKEAKDCVAAMLVSGGRPGCCEAGCKAGAGAGPATALRCAARGRAGGSLAAAAAVGAASGVCAR